MKEQYRGSVDQFKNHLKTAIDNKIEDMNQLVFEKTKVIDDLVADLQENFVVKFWDTLQNINQNVRTNEREALVWRALTKKT